MVTDFNLIGVQPVYLEELNTVFEEKKQNPISIKDMIGDVIINNAPSAHKFK